VSSPRNNIELTLREIKVGNDELKAENHDLRERIQRLEAVLKVNLSHQEMLHAEEVSMKMNRYGIFVYCFVVCLSCVLPVQAQQSEKTPAAAKGPGEGS
jgi:hypothetical protein